MYDFSAALIIAYRGPMAHGQERLPAPVAFFLVFFNEISLYCN